MPIFSTPFSPAIVVMPTAPPALARHPQQRAVPPASTAQLSYPLTAICFTPLRPAMTVGTNVGAAPLHEPSTLLPQQLIVPSSRRAHVCASRWPWQTSNESPATTSSTGGSDSTRTGRPRACVSPSPSSPLRSFPQQKTWAPERTHVCSLPSASCVGVPTGSAGASDSVTTGHMFSTTAASGSVMPSAPVPPSCPTGTSIPVRAPQPRHVAMRSTRDPAMHLNDATCMPRRVVGGVHAEVLPTWLILPHARRNSQDCHHQRSLGLKSIHCPICCLSKGDHEEYMLRSVLCVRAAARGIINSPTCLTTRSSARTNC